MFNVNERGVADGILIIQPLHSLVDKDVINVVCRLKRFTPGQQDGKPMKASFTALITLQLP